jgi:hypothetical protein
VAYSGGSSHAALEWPVSHSFDLIGSAAMTISLGSILLIVLILLLLGVIPTWPHSRSWGYAPSGVIGTILVIVLVLFLIGRL